MLHDQMERCAALRAGQFTFPFQKMGFHETAKPWRQLGIFSNFCVRFPALKLGRCQLCAEFCCRSIGIAPYKCRRINRQFLPNFRRQGLLPFLVPHGRNAGMNRYVPRVILCRGSHYTIVS